MLKAPAVQMLARRVEQGGALAFPGVAAGAQPFFAALLQKLLARPVVLVAENLKTQESFHQDLETWLRIAGQGVPASLPPASRKIVNLQASTVDAAGLAAAPAMRPGGSANFHPVSNLWFYPAWETLPQDGKLPHADVISDRLETLVALSAGGDTDAAPPLVVASVVSLMQKTYAPGSLQRRACHLKRGGRFVPLDLIEFLEEQGYEPEAQVSQKGELALRGGIVDVFPPTSPWPVRLEFFGDELESLRQFDPVTQVSRAEIQEITIPPAGEIGILRNLAPTPDGRRGAAGEGDLAILLAHLPPGTIFVLCEPAALAVQAENYLRQIPPGDALHVSWPEFLAELNRRGFVTIELSEDLWGQAAGLVVLESREDISTSSRTPVAPPNAERPAGECGIAGAERPLASPDAPSAFAPLFGSLDAFRPLAARAPELAVAEAQRHEFFQQLHRWLRQGYAVHVFCNNEGERQRFEEVWKETGRAAEPGSGPADQPCLHLGSLARGFICDQARLVVITDAEVFGRYKVQRPRRLKSPHAQAARSALDIDFTDLEEGDLVVHLQHGIGRYLGLKRLPAVSGHGLGEAEASSL